MSERPAAPRAPWVLVANGFHRRGGMERANFELADHLLDRGHPVHLVGFEIEDALAAAPGATVHRVPRPARSYLLGERLLDRTGRSVARRVTGGDPRARVVVNGGNCLWGDVNWVHYVHHAWRSRAPDAPAWFRAKEWLLSGAARRREAAALSRARLIFANSERTARDLVTRLGLAEETIRTVYLGVDPAFAPVTPEERLEARQWLGIDGERPVVTFVGALGYDRRKGFDTLWSAWQELCRNPEWDAELVVAGGGREVPRWEAELERSGLGDRTRLLGFTDQVERVLAAADVLVSPARYESYGLNVQEALCRGVPALVSADAGVAERYPASLREMLLDDPDDAAELANRLLRWRERREDIRAAFEPVGETLRAWSWPRMAQDMVEAAEAR